MWIFTAVIHIAPQQRHRPRPLRFVKSAHNTESFLCIHDYLVGRTHNYETVFQFCVHLLPNIGAVPYSLFPCNRSFSDICSLCLFMLIKTNTRATISLPFRLFFFSLLASSMGKVWELTTMSFRAFKHNCSRTEERNFGSARDKKYCSQ